MAETFDCTNTKLKRGSSGKKVSTLQTYLKEFGYYTTSNGHYLKIDGVYGVYTEKAVIAFQKATGNKQDGYFGPETCKSLNEKILKKNNLDVALDCPNVNIGRGSKQTEQVKKIQQMLYTLGYYTGRIDGDFAYYTEDSLKDFQKKENLEVTGVVNSSTCTLLTTRYNDKINNKITTTTVTKTVVKKDPNLVDKSKSIYKANEANLSIDGLYFITSSITPDTPFNNSTWKEIEMSNGKYKMYKGHPEPMQWTVELYLHKAELKQLWQEFVKMQNRPCKVVSDDIISGTYVISVKYAISKGFYRKVTLTLREYLV